MKTLKRIEQIEHVVTLAKNACFGDKKIVAADIATDHGYIAKRLAETEYVSKVYATDISAKSLKKLQNLIKFHPKLNIFAFLGDGLEPIDGADIAVIAGIGAGEIIRFLETQNVRPNGEKKCEVFVLQPAQNIVELREYLFDKKYQILKDYFFEDEGRFYPIVAVNISKKEKTEKTIFNLFYGRDNDIQNDDFVKLLVQANKFLEFLNDIPEERIFSDKALAKKYELKKLTTTLLERRKLC